MSVETAVGAAVLSISAWVHNVVNDVVPDAYMDEIFHIPQAQAYCNGSFSKWDPKITTLPGLYLASSAILKPLEILVGQEFSCNTRNLRMTNMIFNHINMVLLYKIFRQRFKDASHASCLLSALALGLSPVLYFFSYLYYTDPISTLTVLLMHYTFLRKQYVLSPLIGLFAILMRQTNVVWLIWHGCNVLWEVGERDFVRLLERQPLAVKKQNPKRESRNQTKRKGKIVGQEEYYHPIPLMKWNEIIDLWPNLVRKVLPKIYMYGISMGIFIGFIILNGGVVVGDKQAHKACINLPQIFYFSLFMLVMSFPVFLYQAKYGLELLWRNKWTFFFWVAVGTAVVYFNTIVHEYTLADNRHYTFYMWKRLYEQRWYLRYLLVPVYMGVAALITAKLELHPSLIFTYVMVISMNLVPQKLLEFRYFILPFFMYRVNVKPFPVAVLIMEAAWVILINYVTIWKFLYQPFEWSHAPGIQRFMW